MQEDELERKKLKGEQRDRDAEKLDLPNFVPCKMGNEEVMSNLWPALAQLCIMLEKSTDSSCSTHVHLYDVFLSVFTCPVLSHCHVLCLSC